MTKRHKESYEWGELGQFPRVRLCALTAAEKLGEDDRIKLLADVQQLVADLQVNHMLRQGWN